MRRKRALITLLVVVAVCALALGLTFKVGNAPLLGLDLEGGVSVRLTPTTDATDEQIDQAIAIMNQRINSLGVAEPDIHREGETIVVQIAGLKDADKDKAIALVGQTAELRFRPVLQQLGPEAPTASPATTAPPAGTPTTTAATTPPGTETGMAPPLVEGESAAAAVAAQTPTVSDQPATPPTTAAGKPNACGSTAPPVTPDTSKTTTPEEDNRAESACQQVILRSDERINPGGGRYLLGPACNPVDQPGTCLTGAALEGATAGIGQAGKWTVNPVFKGGAEGIDKFNALAAKCFSGAPECPNTTGRGQMAMTLDGLVLSAPQINSADFAADRIEISGSFNEETARNLATALKYGSLPVQLRQESTEAVSATLGRDALNAGLAAGAVGLALVALYMIAFYRLLGVVAILKLAVEGALMWAIISYLGATAGLALTLAGVTGIIVSIGVSLDSNVVYYEHLREDLRAGRTLRSAVDRSFGTAWSTILKADGASLLGALLLYWLAVGPVKGFAFFLGLSTVLELLAGYYFMRPVAYLLTDTRLARRRPTLFGLGTHVVTTEPGRTTMTRPSKGGRPIKPVLTKDEGAGNEPEPVSAGAGTEAGSDTDTDSNEASR